MKIVDTTAVPSDLITLVEEARAWGKATARRTRRFDEDDLACGCAIVTAYLFQRMEKRGYRNMAIIMNSDHVFMMWTDWQGGDSSQIGGTTLIIDPTASQIRGYSSALYATPSTDKIPEEQWGWWKVEKMVDSVKELIAAQNHFGWPDEQVAMTRTGPRKG